MSYNAESNPWDREKDLQRQVQTARDQLRDMHTSNESTQAKLMDASQRQGERLLHVGTRDPWLTRLYQSTMLPHVSLSWIWSSLI